MRVSALSAEKPAPTSLALPMAWFIILAVSILPDILFDTLTGSVPAWLFGAKMILNAVLLAASLAWNPIKSLRSFLLVLLSLSLLNWGAGRGMEALGWNALAARAQPFARDMLLVQGPRLLIALLICALLWLLLRKFSRFFLVKGRLSALAAPIPWVMNRPTSWRILGPFFAAALSAGLIVFMLVFGRPPSGELLLKALPLLPLVLLFAATNAFGEELTYRASLLSTLEGAVGPRQALFITAAFFGILHFYGVPYGVLGVVMSAFVGWVMGKAMLETRGFFWSWLIHWCMDISVFIFIAMGSITPGG